MDAPLPLTASAAEKTARYREVRARIESLVEGETDWVAMLSTVACELHHAFESYDWTGFYRVIAPEMLAVGPYQGGHGCLRIPFSRGVCGAAARTRETQLVPDVHAFEGHIACASSTLSEIVVPIFGHGAVVAVLDVDSNAPAAFDEVDRSALEDLCAMLGKHAP
jgi:GAF domain-containing protein